MNKRHKTNLNNEKGFTLAELLIALAVISILAVIAIPRFSDTKIRAYDANAQTTLHYVFKVCKDHWTFNSSMSSCSVSTISDPEYGYAPPDDIEIIIDPEDNNTEYDFVASARHTSSSNVFTINHLGSVGRSTLNVEEAEEQEVSSGIGEGNKKRKVKKKKRKRKKKKRKRRRERERERE